MPILIEGLVGVLLIAGLITQVLVPAYRGTKLFPMFSEKRRDVEDRLTERRENEDIANLEAELTEDHPRSEAPVYAAQKAAQAPAKLSAVEAPAQPDSTRPHQA